MKSSQHLALALSDVGFTGLVPLCDLTTLSASLLDWDDLLSDLSVMEVRLTAFFQPYVT